MRFASYMVAALASSSADLAPAAEEEFALGRLPGAINMPVEELERRFAHLPAGQEIVACCGGSYCVLSVEAVTTLRAKGLQARWLENGFPDWKAAGLRVETSA